MNILERLVPTIRQTRAPLIAGYIWLLLGWLLVSKLTNFKDLIEKKDSSFWLLNKASGSFNDIAVGASITIAAFMTGSMAGFIWDSFLKPLDFRALRDKPTRLFAEAQLRFQTALPLLGIITFIAIEETNWLALALLVPGFIFWHGCGLWKQARTEPIKADLENVDLSNAYLRNANCTHTNFTNANLRLADLTGAKVTSAIFTNAKLDNATLDNVKLNDAAGGLTAEQIRRAKSLKNAKLHNVSLKEVNLRGANLSGAKLNNADLSNAKLENVNLRRADLSNANLSGAKLDDADLRMADLTGANLRGAKLCGAKLNRARLGRVKFYGADFDGAYFTGTILKSADTTEAKLDGAFYLDKAIWDNSTLWPEGLTPEKNLPVRLKLIFIAEGHWPSRLLLIFTHNIIPRLRNLRDR